MIGIIGGIGPEAGNYLHSLIIKNTIASSDKEHFNVLLFSANYIPDRSDFLEKKNLVNPAYTLIPIIDKMIDFGVKIIVFACNQVYSPPIFNLVIKNFSDKNIKFINVITETFKLIDNNIKKVGILSRTGLYKSKMFEKSTHSSNYEFIYLSINSQNILDKIIGDKKTGIKGGFHLKSDKPKQIVEKSIIELINKGAEIVILACTELALVLNKSMYEKYNIIDTNKILARASIKYSDQTKLK